MRFSEMDPHFNALYYFKYKRNTGVYPRLSDLKTQYTYRLIYMAEGECAICVDGANLCLRAGDALYLLPASFYQILPTDHDFSIYSLFFSFSAESAGEGAGFLLAEDYQGALCEAKIAFSDAPLFNKSGVFEGVDCRPLFSSLATLVRADDAFDFHANATLRYLLSLLLRKKDQAASPYTASAPILSYIRENPDADLSADALSKRFLYHKNYINHLVKASTGKTLTHYVQGVKIEYAKTLLSEGGNSLTELALMLGYYDYSHFYKAFVAETGASPSAFRAHRKGEGQRAAQQRGD